ncbi:MAG: 2-oxoglutarate dehydrogenase E1 component [Bdellovibrionales bacterium]
MKIDEQSSYLSRTNLEYLETLYQQFTQDPSKVDQEWARFFEGVEFARAKGLDLASEGGSSSPDEIKVHELIRIYRDYGHLNAKLDPLELSTNSKEFESFKDLGISEINQNENFSVASEIGLPPSTLSTIIDSLEKTYCGGISLQAAECSPNVRKWFRNEFEKQSFKMTKEQQVDVLKQLARTESLEKFIHTRYVGVKRFSIEGCDSLIPMLEYLVEKGTNDLAVEEVTIGMAHRGRVNVLANFMNKALELILAEFNGHMGASKEYDADVKYHMGFSVDKETSKGKKCHVSLAFNPSHLEAVAPVVCGMTRAKQRSLGDTEKREKVIPILIHGDAAVIGQGVVSETFQLSQLGGYKVGGSIHIIMNNQVGFTTNPSDSRSTNYASDIAKTIKAPVILVNADDPEACVRAMDMALRFRQEFKQDVLIDLIGYRRFGHNEGDEPAFTQPLMYSKIKKHPTVYTQYAKELSDTKVFSSADSKKFFDSKIDNLQKIYDDSKTNPPEVKPFAFGGLWEGYKWATPEDLKTECKTQAKLSDLEKVMEKVTSTPEGFKPHSKIKRLMGNRKKMFEEDRLDWGTTELLCYGSLLAEGTSVRLSGQDCKRGTFTHRHSIYVDSDNGTEYSPVAAVNEDKEFCVYNSPLSEMAVLGFEYGNSISDPKFLTIWEAQFGDFANGAQIIIDQFISSGEAKWYRSNGLVLLLPHGYEGQGPEHSSARLERFLQLCAQNNMQVCNFTTPAQLFHGLRRQMKRDFRKPLVVMSPKSLLRHSKVTSSKKDLTDGKFMEVIPDTTHTEAKRVVMCSGKLYYDLLEAQEKSDSKDVALVRLEQLYPFPEEKLAAVISSYKNATEFVWAQEEPQNMGAYWFIAPKLKKVLQTAGKEPELYYAGRTERSSPATGAPSIHQEEQNDIINSCFNF